VWPARSAKRTAEPLVSRDVWRGLEHHGDEPVAWAAAAVESTMGLPPVVALAGPAGTRVVVQVVQADSIAHAAAIAASVTHTPRVGKSLLHDPCWEVVDAIPTSATTAHAAAELRQLIEDSWIAHTGEQLLTDQVLAVRVDKSVSGLRVVSTGRADAVKAAVWAAAACRAVPEAAGVF
jgi:succinate dehydrogenase hydrophobic anchor subunit